MKDRQRAREAKETTRQPRRVKCETKSKFKSNLKLNLNLSVTNHISMLSFSRIQRSVCSNTSHSIGFKGDSTLLLSNFVLDITFNSLPHKLIILENRQIPVSNKMCYLPT